MPDLHSPPVERLLHAGERLSDELRSEIIAMGDAAVPPLLAIFGDEGLGSIDAPDGGWSPIHALELLVDLRAPEAIGPMLDLLVDSDPDEILHDRIQIRLPELGGAVVEPALERLPSDVDDEAYTSICCVLANLGVHDERSYEALSRLLELDPVLGAMCLADYGDGRAAPLIEGAIRNFEPEVPSVARADLADLVESYETLAGPLPRPLADIVDVMQAAWEPERKAPVPAASRKIGRNEPCPCGSGSKYKRCCLANAAT